MTQIAFELLQLQQRQGTGTLIITQANSASTTQWQLCFYMGRLIYGSGGIHRVRRWYRALQQHCPSLFTNEQFTKAFVEGDPWETYQLNQAIAQNWLTIPQAKSVIQSSVREIVFGFLGQDALTTQWHPGKTLIQPAAFISVEQILQEAQELREQWSGSGLGHLQELIPHFSPDLAPVIRHHKDLENQVSQAVYQSLSKLMQGKKTLWDIALQMQRPLATVTRSLLPLIQRETIELKVIPDLPAPRTKPSKPISTSASSAVTSASTSASIRSAAASAITPKVTPKVVIACIDDSPIITQTMERILAPAGYEVLTILNPLQGIATLLERKPALIFLDLVMPNTNGYELCTFLRKTSAFQETPIVILTGHDGVIDRVRARLAGSSEFLSKPPESAKVLQMVHKFLGEPEPLSVASAASEPKFALS